MDDQNLNLTDDEIIELEVYFAAHGTNKALDSLTYRIARAAQLIRIEREANEKSHI